MVSNEQPTILISIPPKSFIEKDLKQHNNNMVSQDTEKSINKKTIPPSWSR